MTVDVHITAHYSTRLFLYCCYCLKLHRSTSLNLNKCSCLFIHRRNCDAAQKTPKGKPQHSRGTEKTVSERGRNERKSAKRRKRRRRSVKKSARRRGNGRENERGRETENGTGIEKGRGTEEHVAVTLTAATPVEHQTGKGADPGIAGGPGAEIRTERESANAAGMAGFIGPPSSSYSLWCNG